MTLESRVSKLEDRIGQAAEDSDSRAYDDYMSGLSVEDRDAEFVLILWEECPDAFEEKPDEAFLARGRKVRENAPSLPGQTKEYDGDSLWEEFFRDELKAISTCYGVKFKPYAAEGLAEAFSRAGTGEEEAG